MSIFNALALQQQGLCTLSVMYGGVEICPQNNSGRCTRAVTSIIVETCHLSILLIVGVESLVLVGVLLQRCQRTTIGVFVEWYAGMFAIQ